MSSADSGSNQNKSVNFDPILPETGLLFYEECPLEFEIEGPRLLPLRTSTQIRLGQQQQEVARVWKEKQKEIKKTATKTSVISSEP